MIGALSLRWPVRRAGSRFGCGGATPVRYGLATLLALAIFWVQIVTSINGAIVVLYVMVLVLAVGDPRASTSSILACSALCVVLTVIGFSMTRHHGSDSTLILRLCAGLSTNAVTTLLLVKARLVRETLWEIEERHRTIFNSLAIAIWEHDFTPVQAAIAAIRNSGIRDLRRYVAEHPEFVIAARKMVRITDVNDSALEMMGVPSKPDFFRHLSDFLPETDESFAECIIAIDERRPIFQVETIVMTRAGDPLNVIVAFGLGGMCPLDRVPGSILDITSRKRLEVQVERTRAELAQVQRASVMGAISASIAHEVNQPLSAIQSYSDAGRQWLSRPEPDLPEAIRAMESLGRAVGHARDVVQRVRALVSTAKSVSAEVDLTQLVVDVAALMRLEAESQGARIVVDPGTASEHDRVIVLGDRILLKQVLVNLVTNGLQALGDTAADRRVVLLSTRAEGDTAYLRVADSGQGWDGMVLERAFQTFFTTKQDGMGLGLSICRATMESHGGTLILSNAEGGGAIVEAALPRFTRSSSLVAERASDDIGQHRTVEWLVE